MNDTMAFNPVFETPMPEEMKAASERMLNLWVGAFLPLWAPFWAAAGLGVGAWAMTRNFKPAESLMAEMSESGWGLFRSWGLEAGELREKAVDAVGDVARTATPVKDAAAASEALIENAADTGAETAKTLGDGMAAAADIAAEMAGSVSEAAPEVVKPPKVVKPPEVVKPEAAAETVAETASVAPKAIARNVSAARKPRSKT